MKIITVCNFRGETEILYKSLLKDISASEYKCTYYPYLECKDLPNPYQLDVEYKNPRSLIRSYHNKLQDYIMGNNYDIFIVQQNLPIHPDFILNLKMRGVKTAFWTGDDPESSYLYTVPYVHAYDFVFCYGVQYDQCNKVTDKLYQWGAKKAKNVPFGCLDFRTRNMEFDCHQYKNRNIDIIYIGNEYIEKNDRLFELKSRFSDKFLIHGKRWGGRKGVLRRVIRNGIFLNPKPVSEANLPNIYADSKVGINFHMSYGPSNVRFFELCANGVMQITDNPEGTNYFLKEGSEVVTYRDFNECSALIDYYLNNDDERIRIAEAGRLRVVNNYLHSNMLVSIFNYMRGSNE